jgi:hypothetical protein
MQLLRLSLVRSPLCAAAGFLFAVLLAAVAPAQAQSSNAADLCAPDVMKLCQEAIPDANDIVKCLRKKRRQVSSECRTAMRKTKPAEASALLDQHGNPAKRRGKRR